MEQEQSQADVVKRYLNLILVRHRFITACVLIAATAGLFVYLSKPKIYQSSATLVYQQQRINVSRSSQDDGRRLDEMVRTISQQVLSRSSLEGIIKNHDLYPGMRQAVPVEDVIEKMREKDIEISMDRSKGNTFTVSFRGRDPRKVSQVTNSLASKFIEENLQLREERAKETASYIQDELQMAKKRLNEQEARMRDYKQKHYNEMPQQRTSNMDRLNSLQEQYQSIQRDINDLSHTRLLIGEQIQMRRELQSAESENSGSGGSSGEQGGALGAARSRLQELLTRYTPEHPEVKRQEKRVSRLEEKRQELFQAGSQQDSEGSGQQGRGTADQREAELVSQLREIDANLQAKRSEAEEIRKKIKNYEEWVEAAPAREAEWSELTRDYDELKEYHDELLSQSLAASATESLESRQKGSQFKIVDSAYVPRTPVKGTFAKILLVSLAMGLAAGSGLVLGPDLVNTSFKSVKEIEAELGIPVTCSVPLIVTEKEQRRTRLKKAVVSSFLLIWLIALAGTAAYFWQQGDIII